MVFTKLLLENALAIRPCNCEVVLEPFLPKVARCIPVLSSRYMGRPCFEALWTHDRLYMTEILPNLRSCGAAQRKPTGFELVQR